MKKRALMLSLVLALALSLAGCACEHEWTEADCVHASICSKCEEVQGEALGHDWQAATCEAPETCSRCGETQGQALEHTYGQWVVPKEADATEMKHTCEICGSEETAAIDQEIILRNLLLGHWDFSIWKNAEDQVITASQFADTYIGPYLYYAEDGSVTFFDITTVHSCKLVFDDYYPDESLAVYGATISLDSYFFHLENEAGEVICPLSYRHFPDMEDASYIEMIIEEESVGHNAFLLGRDSLAEDLAGVWSSKNNYSLELREDRTFTARFDTEFSGTWHLRAGGLEGNDIYCGLTLKYEKNGQTVITTDKIHLGKPTSDWKTSLKMENNPSITLLKGLITLQKESGT